MDDHERFMQALKSYSNELQLQRKRRRDALLNASFIIILALIIVGVPIAKHFFNTPILDDAISAFLSSSFAKFVVGFVMLAGIGVFAGPWSELSQEESKNISAVIKKAIIPGFFAWIMMLVLISGIFLAVFYYEATHRHNDHASWEKLKEQGIAGMNLYLAQNQFGNYVLDAKRFLAREELNSTVTVSQSYVEADDLTFPIELRLTEYLLSHQIRHIDLKIAIYGTPLSQNYKKRGKLYTGAILSGAVGIYDAESSECIVSDEFSSRINPPEAISLLETSSGPNDPSEAPFPSLYEDFLSFTEGLIQKNLSEKPEKQ